MTGTSKGIGAEIAKGLAAAGSAVVVNYASSKEGAEAVDVLKTTEAKRLIEAALTEFSRLDVLVNNPGIWGVVPIEQVTEEQFHRSFGVNVLGAILTTQAALEHLGEGGSIINISSNATTIHPSASSTPRRKARWKASPACSPRSLVRARSALTRCRLGWSTSRAIAPGGLSTQRSRSSESRKPCSAASDSPKTSPTWPSSWPLTTHAG